jgi:hypothetical protein
VGVVELTRLEGLDHDVGLIGEEPDHDRILEALGPPVVRVADEPRELPGLPLGERVGARADERRVELLVRDRLVVVLAPDVLGQDRHVDLEDPVGLVARVGDEGAGVGALDLRDARVLHVRVR